MLVSTFEQCHLDEQADRFELEYGPQFPLNEGLLGAEYNEQQWHSEKSNRALQRLFAALQRRHTICHPYTEAMPKMHSTPLQNSIKSTTQLLIQLILDRIAPYCNTLFL